MLQEQIQLFQPQGSLDTVPWLGLALDGSEADFTVLSREPLNCVCSVTQPCPTLCDPKDCSPPGSSVHGILQARTLECVAMPLSIFPTQGLNPDPPALQVDSLPAEPPGQPMNTGVGSLSPLQGIFPSQESTWGLLHCRWILYQLSHQGSP